jgi:gas vesicle protein
MSKKCDLMKIRNFIKECGEEYEKVFKEIKNEINILKNNTSDNDILEYIKSCEEDVSNYVMSEKWEWDKEICVWEIKNIYNISKKMGEKMGNIIEELFKLWKFIKNCKKSMKEEEEGCVWMGITKECHTMLNQKKEKSQNKDW